MPFIALKLALAGASCADTAAESGKAFTFTRQKRQRIFELCQFDLQFTLAASRSECENIKNDFPIELNCSFNKKAEILEKELVTQRESSKKKLLSFANNIITSMYSNEGADIYKVVENCIGIDAIIKFKFSQKIELNYEEIEYLVSKLK